MALSISGPPCSRKHEGTAHGSCSFLKLPSGALCPEAPGPAHSPAMLGQPALASLGRGVQTVWTACGSSQPAPSSHGGSRGAAGQDGQNPRGGVALLTLAVTPDHPLIALVRTSRVTSVGVASAKRLSAHRFGSWSVGETEVQKGHKPGKNRGGGRGKPTGTGLVVSRSHPPSSPPMRKRRLREGALKVHGNKLQSRGRDPGAHGNWSGAGFSQPG